MKSVATSGCILAATAVVMAMPAIAVADQGDPLRGMKYGDAVAAIAKAEPKAKVAVSSSVGSLLQRDDCIVTHSTRRVDRISSIPVGQTIVMSLDCNPALASEGRPGGSLASPGGKAAKSIENNLALINAHPELCDADAAAHERCVNFCENTVPGQCTFDLK